MTKKCKQIVDHFDGYGDAAVWRGVPCPMYHIQGFTGSHGMWPLGKYQPCIALAAAKVINFE
jgi:hypothetical protein